MVTFNIVKFFSILILLITAGIASAQKVKKETSAIQIPGKVWTAEKANAWYEHHKWITGANYIPTNSINQLEMWQADSFGKMVGFQARSVVGGYFIKVLEQKLNSK